jgi:hypothetical protein
MPQNPLTAAVAKNPSNVVGLLNTDAEGNLLVASASGGDAVTIADGADVAEGATTATAWSGTGAGTVISILKAAYAKLVATLSVKLAGQKYVTVAASQTKAPLGTGAIGDTLNTLVIVPATTSPGAVGLYDSSGGTEIIVFTGGATSVADLKPITITVNMVSAAGGWEVTTGANVSVIAVGQFTP